MINKLRMESRKTGLLRLRHLNEVTEAVQERMDEQSPRFDRLADPSSAPRAISAFNLFQTPEDIADRMAAMLGDLDGRRILEPSAGLGRLYHATRKRSAESHITLVEIAPQCASELYRVTAGDGHCKLLQADFLMTDVAAYGNHFDRIIMNPPFKMWRDVKHIDHALTLLAPGGLLVALCANGPRQNELLKPRCDSWEVLPANSFRSEGTPVSVAMLIIRN